MLTGADIGMARGESMGCGGFWGFDFGGRIGKALACAGIGTIDEPTDGIYEWD